MVAAVLRGGVALSPVSGSGFQTQGLGTGGTSMTHALQTHLLRSIKAIFCGPGEVLTQGL